ncbi:unnamed protein product [Musa hybrid cultivar]
MRSYNEHCPLSVATPHAQQRSLLFLLAKVVEEDSTSSELLLFTPLLSTATTNDGPILWCHQIGGSFKVDLGCPRHRRRRRRRETVRCFRAVLPMDPT